MKDNNNPKTPKEPEIASVFKQYPVIGKAVAASFALLVIFWIIPKPEKNNSSSSASKEVIDYDQEFSKSTLRNLGRDDSESYRKKRKSTPPTKYFNINPNPKPKEPTPTEQDKRNIGVLEGQYSTRAAWLAKIKTLKLMVSKLSTAMTRVDPTNYKLFDTVKAVRDSTANDLRATQNQVEFIDGTIRKLEEKITKNLDRSYLPAQPTKVGSYVINTASDYNNLKVNYPRLFN